MTPDYTTAILDAAAAVAAVDPEPEPYWPAERELEAVDDEAPWCACDGSCPACRASNNLERRREVCTTI